MLDLATNRQLQQHHHNKKTNEKEKGKIHLSSFVYCALSNRIFDGHTNSIQHRTPP